GDDDRADARHELESDDLRTVYHAQGGSERQFECAVQHGAATYTGATHCDLSGAPHPPPAGHRQIRHTDVVKIQASTSDAGAVRTRDAVARLILEQGPQTAAALAGALRLSPAAIRRHLDALVADNLLTECDPRPLRRRGRGRPARAYAL